MLTTALAAGLSPETLRKIETGRVATPAFSTIASLATLLDLSLDTLWATISEDLVVVDHDLTPPSRPKAS